MIKLISYLEKEQGLETQVFQLQCEGAHFHHVALLPSLELQSRPHATGEARGTLGAG